jgi:hypothetical protein
VRQVPASSKQRPWGGSTLSRLWHTLLKEVIKHSGTQFGGVPHTRVLQKLESGSLGSTLTSLHKHKVILNLTCGLLLLTSFGIVGGGGGESNWVHSALRPPIGLLCQPRVIMMMEKLVEWLAVEAEVLRGKPAPVPLCPPQTPHAAGTRTRPAAVGSQRLTAWATARPYQRHIECGAQNLLSK